LKKEARIEARARWCHVRVNLRITGP